MGEKARKYSPSTIRRLDTLSGNECAAPDCSKKLIARDNETIVSKICHIEAASKNGPRYNPTMDDNDRRHFNNLILLCDECHGIIDNKINESRYPVSTLVSWKKNHESKFQQAILINNPNFLTLAINGIAELNFESSKEEQEDLTVFRISDKISYNNIKRNRFLIEEYSQFYNKINSLYNVLEQQGSFKKQKLLRNIHQLYIRVKGKYVASDSKELELIQNNADSIIEDIENKLLELVDQNQAGKDDIAFAIPIIMVDAFMRCNILEKPENK